MFGALKARHLLARPVRAGQDCRPESGALKARHKRAATQTSIIRVWRCYYRSGSKCVDTFLHQKTALPSWPAPIARFRGFIISNIPTPAPMAIVDRRMKKYSLGIRSQKVPM